jgi:hypothetical protein
MRHSSALTPLRHSGEGRNPFCFSVHHTTGRKWIPAFAGMTEVGQPSRAAQERT